MPPQNPRRLPAHMVGVEGARHYGVGGNQPADAVVTGIKPHSRTGSVQYVSDAPYVQPYSERLICSGIRRDKKPCGAKARSGGRCCDSHVDQE